MLMVSIGWMPQDGTNPQLTRIRIQEYGKDSVVMTFRADRTITQWQKPSLEGGSVVVRFPGVARSSAIAIDSSVTQLSSSVIRGILVERIRPKFVPVAAAARRDGPRDIVVVIRAAGTTPRPPDEKKSNDAWALDVIVLDPGHGGVDVGAISVNGAYEKNITLAIARLVRDKLKKAMPKTKVMLTRDSDTFIELYRRGQIANESGGKLFISIHCNSMPNKPHPANGCETYILRPGRNDDATRVAARENASVRFEQSQDRYAALSEDQLIVATMAQRSFVRLSEELARHIQKEVSASTGLKNRGVNQAGFFVLVGASMPNVLFETAFLSNSADAKLIESPSGQESVAQALVKAIQRYARTYSTLLDQ
jgi:N-acetylmuramoyl-L-alanine amidase